MENHLLDRFAGTLLGMAAGDTYGAPADDLTPYRTWAKYGQMDSFHPPGKYTAITQLALLECMTLLGTGGKVDAEASKRTLLEAQRKGTARWKDGVKWRHDVLRCVPLGLLNAANPQSDEELLMSCKKTHSIREVSMQGRLASFCVAWMVKEIVRNHDNLKSMSDLCLADLSMVGRLIDMCYTLEKRHGSDDPLWKRLDYARKRADAGAGYEEFVGTCGNSHGPAEALSFSLFCFLKGPDSISSVQNAASCGGATALNAATVGTLVGAYAGSAFIPDGTRNCIEGFARIVELSRRLSNAIDS